MRCLQDRYTIWLDDPREENKQAPCEADHHDAQQDGRRDAGRRRQDEVRQLVVAHGPPHDDPLSGDGSPGGLGVLGLSFTRTPPPEALLLTQQIASSKIIASANSITSSPRPVLAFRLGRCPLVRAGTDRYFAAFSFFFFAASFW